MSERKYFFLGQKKMIFIGAMHCVRERDCFPKKNLENNLSLSHTMHNSYKYYLLWTQEKIFSFAHSTFLTINSLTSSLLFVFFSLLRPSLSPPLAYSLPTDFSLYLPLFSFFSLFLLPSITPFFNKVFFFAPHRSVNSSITIFSIYQTLCTGLVCQ